MSWQLGSNAKNRTPGKARRPSSAFRFEALERRQLLAADLVSVSPADNASGVGVDDNLVLTFSSDVKLGPGAGRILIKNAADDALIEAIDIDSDRVSISGATVTVDPVNPLPAEAKLYVQLDAAGLRDTATTKAQGVLFREDFETLHLIDSPLAIDGVYDPALDTNNYVLTMTGTLDVQTAGDYTFGSNTDDGGYLAIDLDGNGEVEVYEGSADIVIWDNTTHGNKDVFAEFAVTLAKGQYKFEFGYFEGGSGSSGEYFYAPGEHTVFDAAKFAIVGDASQGIGVTEEGITATTIKAPEGTAVGNLTVALELRDGFTEPAEGFPVSAKIPTADVWNTGGTGNYAQNNPIPGVPPTDLGVGTDYSVEPPVGWVRENSVENSQPVYNGFAFLDKNFWIHQQGNQDRFVWSQGEGVVAVLDADAFDDFTGIGATPLDAYLTLPAIDLTDVTKDSVTIDFASSWRPYDEMTGLVDVSFDGGENWENVLTLDLETTGPNSSLERADELVSLTVANPSGGSMLVRFGMINCNNDWWWGVDNIVVKAEAVGDLHEGIADRTAWNFNTLTSTVGLPGDFNGDGEVDLTDFGILKANFGTGTTAGQGDANNDAKVDLTDFGILKSNFGKSAVALRAADYVFAVAATEAARAAAADSGEQEAADPFADESVADELLV